jgi:hypothetical protein
MRVCVGGGAAQAAVMSGESPCIPSGLQSCLGYGSCTPNALCIAPELALGGDCGLQWLNV